MNVHKRCQTNVGNNCGTNTKQVAEVLQLIGQKAHGIKINQKKVSQKSSLWLCHYKTSISATFLLMGFLKA